MPENQPFPLFLWELRQLNTKSSIFEPQASFSLDEAMDHFDNDFASSNLYQADDMSFSSVDGMTT